MQVQPQAQTRKSNRIAQRREEKTKTELNPKQTRNIEILTVKVEQFMLTYAYADWKEKAQRIRADDKKRSGPNTIDLLDRVNVVRNMYKKLNGKEYTPDKAEKKEKLNEE